MPVNKNTNMELAALRTSALSDLKVALRKGAEDQLFHIHIDAKKELSEAGRKYLVGLGFNLSNFSGGDYVPKEHHTLKLHSSLDFNRSFAAVASYLDSHKDELTGYVEGEFVALHMNIPLKPFDPTIQIPFRITTTQLPEGVFRGDEIHITLDSTRSDPRLLQNLSEDMGLYPANLQKDYGPAKTFTVQAKSKEEIEKLLPHLIVYLYQAGGAARCVVKEERIANHWLSDKKLKLPPVIENITYLQ
jgi:hypothetical protein